MALEKLMNISDPQFIHHRYHMSIFIGVIVRRNRIPSKIVQYVIVINSMVSKKSSFVILSNLPCVSPYPPASMKPDLVIGLLPCTSLPSGQSQSQTLPPPPTRSYSSRLLMYFHCCLKTPHVQQQSVYFYLLHWILKSWVRASHLSGVIHF